jgi:hypothetical protein
MHHHYQAGFDGFTWAPALAFVRGDDVIFNNPWIDQAITPIEAAPGSPLFMDDIRMTHMFQADPGFVPNASLPRSKEATLAAESRIHLSRDTCRSWLGG